MSPKPTPEAAAAEFNLWADQGRGESMARGHAAMTKAAISTWRLSHDSVALDVGCGSGHAVQLMVNAGAGHGMGIDVSPNMIALAQKATASDDRFGFIISSADDLPLDDESVDHILSVESIYYYPSPADALKEWARVATAGADLAIAIDLYQENQATHVWIEALDVDVHLLSIDHLIRMVQEAGFEDVTTEKVIDPRPLTPKSDFEVSEYWPSYEMYEDYRRTGALLLRATRASL